MTLLTRSRRYLTCLAFGAYVVGERIQYGRLRLVRTFRRFRTLQEAKAFARRIAAEVGNPVLVSHGYSMETLRVYKPRG